MPDAGPERLADPDPDPDGDADDQEANQGLDDKSIALAEAGQTVAVPALLFRFLGLGFPMVLARPYLAVGASFSAFHRSSIEGFSRADDSFNVCVERVCMGEAGGSGNIGRARMAAVLLSGRRVVVRSKGIPRGFTG